MSDKEKSLKIVSNVLVPVEVSRKSQELFFWVIGMPKTFHDVVNSTLLRGVILNNLICNYNDKNIHEPLIWRFLMVIDKLGVHTIVV